MNFRKNFANYIAWGLMCIILFAGVGVSAIGVSEKAGNEAYLIYVGIFYAIFLILTALLIPIFRIVKEFVESKADFGSFKFEGVLEGVFIAVAIAVSVIVRFAYAISVFLKTDASDVLLGTTAYYDFAQGTVTSIGTANNGAYLYTSLLKFIFGFAGNDVIAVYILQAVLALGTILFTFFALRKLSGKISSWIFLVLASFLPGSLELFMYCTPGLMISFLFAGFFFGMTMLMKAYLDEKITDAKIFVYYVLAGALAGFISYFDPIGLVLIPLTAYAIVSFRKKPKEDRKPEKYEQTKLHIIYFVVGALGFLIFSLFAFPAGIGAGMSGIARYFSLFASKGINLTILTPHYGNYDSLALFIFAGLWLLAFLKAIRDRVFPMIVITVFMVLYYLFSFDHLDYSALISTCFIIIGSFGLKSLSFLILPVEAENVEQAREKLAEMDRKKREKVNRRLENKLEKQSKKAIKNGSGIVLGKNIEHDAIVDDEPVKPEEKTQVAEAAADTNAETNTETNTENTKESETKANEAGEVLSDNNSVEVAENNNVEASVPENNTENVPVSVGTNNAEATSEVVEQTEDKSAEEQVTTEQIAEDQAVNDVTTEEVNVAETVAVTEFTENNTEINDAAEKAVDSVQEASEAEAVTESIEISNTASENADATEQVSEGADTEPVVNNDSAVNSEVSAVAEEANKVEESAENTEAVKEETTTPPKKELPPYVPQVMLRRRGKMFSPVKKAEPAPENKELDSVGAELAEVAVAAATVAAVNENAESSESALNTVATNTNEAVTEAVSESASGTQEVVSEASEVNAGAVAETSVEATENVTETVRDSAEITEAANVSSENVTEAPVEVAGETAETTAESVVSPAETTEEPIVAVVPSAPGKELSAVKEAPVEEADNTADNTAENDKEVKLIKNPVAGPKEHVHKELAFDYDPKEDELDFDLKDLSGKDFYDI